MCVCVSPPLSAQSRTTYFTHFIHVLNANARASAHSLGLWMIIYSCFACNAKPCATEFKYTYIYMRTRANVPRSSGFAAQRHPHETNTHTHRQLSGFLLLVIRRRRRRRQRGRWLPQFYYKRLSVCAAIESHCGGPTETHTNQTTHDPTHRELARKIYHNLLRTRTREGARNAHTHTAKATSPAYENIVIVHVYFGLLVARME